jgi:hypothetical protein
MKHSREFWTLHVKGWRASGLTKAQYCRRHRFLKGTLGYWASTLKGPKGSGSALVEAGNAEVQPEQRHSAVELMVERRYLLRLWPGVEAEHLGKVLSVLDRRP